MQNVLNHRGLVGLVVAVCVSFPSIGLAQPASPPSSTQPAEPEPPRQAREVPPEVAAGNAAFERQDWAAAAEHYRQAVAKGYDYAFMQMRAGYALHVQGKFEEALPFHLRAANAQQKALRIDGLYNAACASARLNQSDKAFEYLLKAIDAGFLDKKQIEGDSDLDSLRNDERFKSIVASIGVEPTLAHWMDFFIGDWEQFDPESADARQVLDHLTMSRPLAGSSAIVSTSRNIGGGEWTGMAWPDSDERIWRWTKADGTGTTHEFIGKRIEGAA